MKLSEYKSKLKEAVKIRLALIRASVIFTFQREFAYAGNNWTSILSTTFFTFSVLIFVNVLYANVKTIAGYDKNEMLVYFFIYQMTYYANWMFTGKNMQELIPDVNSGNLDLILTKPVPSLFYLMTRSISVFSILTDAIPPTLAIVLSINWNSLNFTPQLVFTGLVIWVLGLIALHTFQFLATIPVFWLGESQNISDLAGTIGAGAGTMIPLEGYSRDLRILLGMLLPVLIAGGFTTSVLLGKSDPLFLFIWALVMAVLAIIVRNAAWKLVLRHYSSASS